MDYDIIHWPDLSFQKYCKRTFNINRGIYNTIDSWFYEQGEEKLLQRRSTILLFLQYSETINKNNTKFGKGGLVIKLREFYEYNQSTLQHVQ